MQERKIIFGQIAANTGDFFVMDGKWREIFLFESCLFKGERESQATDLLVQLPLDREFSCDSLRGFGSILHRKSASKQLPKVVEKVEQELVVVLAVLTVPIQRA